MRFHIHTTKEKIGKLQASARDPSFSDWSEWRFGRSSKKMRLFNLYGMNSWWYFDARCRSQFLTGYNLETKQEEFIFREREYEPIFIDLENWQFAARDRKSRSIRRVYQREKKKKMVGRRKQMKESISKEFAQTY
jgi:hypothetical protein